MFNIFEPYSTDQIKDALGWADAPQMSDLVQAVMVLCDTVYRLERRVVELEAAEEKLQADADLAFSVALYTPSPSA